VSWGSGVRKAGRHRAQRRVWQLLAPATAVLAGTALWAALPAGGAAARSQGADGGAGVVTYQVSAAAQRAALAFWTPARMKGAQADVTVPRAAQARTRVSPPKGIPKAVPFSGVPTTGALFGTTGSKTHFCTAAVVNSTAGDLVVTAAHCVDPHGLVSNIAYVPEYHNGKSPYGAWAVRTITVAAGWQKSHDPDLDFAFLAVGAAGGPKIQARTGGLKVGYTRWYRETIEVVGYNDTAAEPVRCLTKSFKFRTGQMEFYCHGFWAGTSGSPWIIGYNAKTGGGTVFGVIGGYQEGGDYDWASYSAYFGTALRNLFVAAEKQQVPPQPPPTPTPGPVSPSPSAA
jgi:V8-like Glu-specific endopeptidase